MIIITVICPQGYLVSNVSCAHEVALSEKNEVPFSMVIGMWDSCTSVSLNTRTWEKQE